MNTTKTETTDTAAAEIEASPTGIAIVDGKAKVADLRPHPENVKIYGDKDSVTDLVKHIEGSEKGILEPLVITPTGEIIGGHRRFRAAQQLKLEQVPVRVFNSTDELETLDVLLGLNRHRVKTGVQIGNEANLLKELTRKLREREKQKAIAEGAKLPPQGKTRDLVAKSFGMSGRTADKAAKAAKGLAKLQAEGKDDDAAEVEAALEKSIERGLKVAVEKGAVPAPKAKNKSRKKAIVDDRATPAEPATDTVGDQSEKNLSELSAPATPAASTLDSDAALTHADHALTFLRSESAKAMNDQQRRDWTKVLNHITACQAALNL